MSTVPSPFRQPSSAVFASPALSGNALAVGSMILWAAGFPAAELLLDDWHPVVLITLRLIMAMVFMIPLWLLMDGRVALSLPIWRRGIRIGFFGFGLATTLLLFAQWYTDPVTVALVASFTPILAAFVELWFGDRRLTRTFVAGMTLSVAGGIVAVGGNVTPDLGVGLGLAVISGLLFAWASRAAVKDLPTLTPLGRTTVTFGGALVFVLIMMAVCLVFDLVPVPTVITGSQIGLLAIYAIAAMALSQILFIASVGRIGVALTSCHVNIAPFYVMVIVAFLGGGWNNQTMVGAAIVGIGVIWSQRTPTLPLRSVQPRDAS